MNFRSKCKHVAFHPFKFTMHVFKVTSEKGEFSSVSLEQRNRDSMNCKIQQEHQRV